MHDIIRVRQNIEHRNAHDLAFYEAASYTLHFQFKSIIFVYEIKFIYRLCRKLRQEQSDFCRKQLSMQ